MQASDITKLISISSIILMLSACLSGDSVNNNDSATASSCDGECLAATPSNLTIADVERVLAQAIAEAQARNANATIAVVDRVGNVLAVYRMTGVDTTITINSGRANVNTGLDGLTFIPDDLVAISKAVTGAYLSSEGNAFSTRTASQIVQQHFNPGETDQPGGPLFGVQFSNLPCSDINTRFTPGDMTGPKRSPLGLSADPGGFPLYKNGTPVGGVGVIADGVYGLDVDISDIDQNLDELIAYAASTGYIAPVNRRAERITVEGKTLRFSDVGVNDLLVDPANAASFATIPGSVGALLAVTGYTDVVPAVIAGTVFGDPASGIRASGNNEYIIVDNVNTNRYPPIVGTNNPSLSAFEVDAILDNALQVANRARAQIRRPLGTNARVTVAVVDLNGVVLGVVRNADAPVFGIDVAVQKARTAVFFSSSPAAEFALPADTEYLNPNDPLDVISTVQIFDYVDAVRTFMGDPFALSATQTAFGDRAGGNLSRPYFPDGLVGSVHGPFSKPFNDWSPFSTGLQSDLIMNRVVQHILFTTGAPVVDPPQNCTAGGAISAIPNGIQIFPGSVPIYIGQTLVGGIGVSGDGVDQDDMIAILAVHNARGELGGPFGNAPTDIRADNLTPMGIRLRYVQCPQSPYIDSDETNVCADI